MNSSYIIPANSKKSQLILGFFTWTDFILFATGVSLTLILLLLVQSTDIVVMLLILLPALLTGFLVLPIPNYHNVLQFLTNVYTFYSNRREYKWRGWCYNGEDK